jgi:MFS family permease
MTGAGPPGAERPAAKAARLGRRAASRIPRLLLDTTFRRYWSAQTISMFGDQISAIAIPLAAVLVLHASAAEMGYLTALVWLPSLLFGLHAGAWVDRHGQRRATMIAADIGRFALLISLPLTYALHALTLTQLYGVAFGTGLLSVLFFVGNSAVFVAIVPAEQYIDGNALIYASRALSFVGGPSLGGLLVQLLSAPFAIVADALSFLGSAFFLRRIHPTEAPPDRSGKGSVTAGARFIVGSPIVRASLLAVAVINFFNLMFSALYLLYAVRTLHISAGLIGVVLGAAATKRLAGRIGVGWAYAAGCALFTAPLMLVPLAGGPKLLVLGTLFVAEFLSGFGVMVLDISIGAIFAVVIPDALKSRVTGAFQAVNYGTRPLGAVLGGLLGTELGLRDALWIATAGGVIGFLLLLPSPLPGFRMPGDAAAPTGAGQLPDAGVSDAGGPVHAGEPHGGEPVQPGMAAGAGESADAPAPAAADASDTTAPAR